jgi:hypothetical protein
MATIIPFPHLHQAVFDEKQTAMMAKVLEEVCFKLIMLEDRAWQIIAAHIFELVRRGQLDPKKLRDQLISEATVGREL